MRHLMLTFVFGLTLFGCTKSTVCDTGKVVSGLVSAQVAVALDCKNVDAVKADIEKKLYDLKICQAPTAAAQTAGAIGEAICKPVIDGLVAGLLTQLPATWQCSGGPVTDDLKAKILAACVKAF